MKIWMVLLIVGVFFLAACAPNAIRELQPTGPDVIADMPAGEEEIGDRTELGDPLFVTRGVKHIVPLNEIVWGCPRKDCIPSIDNPKFISAAQAEEDGEVSDNSVVFGIVYKGEARAYPQHILNWHEIVNDVIQGDPILISFCPLCDTAIAFKGEVEGQPTEFGVSGRLRNNNLIMYDRRTDTLWAQYGKALVGKLVGQRLKQLPIETTFWKDWKAAHPETKVLSRDTGFSRSYDRYPYRDFRTSTDIFFPLTNEDDRLHPKDKVFGVVINGQAKAYREITVQDQKIIHDEISGQRLLVFAHPVSGGILMFDPGTHTFEFGIDGLLDENGDSWSYEGKKTDGTEELVAIDNIGAFWFSWAAENPGTDIYG